jgi:hypothetical protein
MTQHHTDRQDFLELKSSQQGNTCPQGKVCMLQSFLCL